MQKAPIREEMINKRIELSATEKAKMSKAICEKIISSDDFKKADIIALYMTIKSEVDVQEVIENAFEFGKTVLLPKVDGDDMNMIRVHDIQKSLSIGVFSVNEPIDATPYEGNIDIVFVPGVAFDRKGNRIGFGKGYYDKFLHKMKDKIKKQVGVCYDFQLVTSAYANKNDISMNELVTEREWIVCEK